MGTMGTMDAEAESEEATQGVLDSLGAISNSKLPDQFKLLQTAATSRTVTKDPMGDMVLSMVGLKALGDLEKWNNSSDPLNITGMAMDKMPYFVKDAISGVNRLTEPITKLEALNNAGNDDQMLLNMGKNLFNDAMASTATSAPVEDAAVSVVEGAMDGAGAGMMEEGAGAMIGEAAAGTVAEAGMEAMMESLAEEAIAAIFFA